MLTVWDNSLLQPCVTVQNSSKVSMLDRKNSIFNKTLFKYRIEETVDFYFNKKQNTRVLHDFNLFQ